MSIDKLIDLLVTLTLFEMKAAIGLDVTLDEIASVARNRSLVARRWCPEIASASLKPARRTVSAMGWGRWVVSRAGLSAGAEA